MVYGVFGVFFQKKKYLIVMEFVLGGVNLETYDIYLGLSSYYISVCLSGCLSICIFIWQSLGYRWLTSICIIYDKVLCLALPLLT